MRLWIRRLPKSVLKCVDDGLMWRWCETEMVRSPEKRPEFCVWVWSARAMVPTYLEKPEIRPEQRKLPQIRPENCNPEKRPGICCHIYVFGGKFQDIW